MQLIIQGIDKLPKEKGVSLKELAQKCAGETKGCFKYEYSFETLGSTLQLTFTTCILVAKGLGAEELNRVRIHEKHHYQDFCVLVHKLRSSLASALSTGVDADLDNRMKWFDYDICMAAANFHRSENRVPLFCLPPYEDRPK